MAQNITIAGAEFSDVPAIVVPATGGGQAVFADPSGTTATASDVAQGKVFLDSDGEYQTGTASGGSPVSVPSKDVDFYDYDGTRVYSYTAAEFAALTEMPANPDHSHDAVPLTAQGWNWTLTNAKAYVATYGGLVIGQTYIPTDGKTHILITIPSNAPYARRNFILYFGQTVSRGVTVDWGDGTSETFSGTTATTHTHQYTDTGDYDITLAVTSGKLNITGTNSGTAHGIYGPVNAENSHRREYIHAVHIGSNVSSTIGVYAFYQCDSLAYCTIPIGVTGVDLRAFDSCRYNKIAILPSGCTWIGGSCFINNNSLCAISLPYGMNTINQQAFEAVLQTRKVTIPEGVTYLYDHTFNGEKNLAVALIPNGVTTIDSQAFNFCFQLFSVTIPSSVTTINAQAFNRCNTYEYHMRRTSPPTLANVNAFGDMPSDCIIYVPRGSLNAYKTASNWSSYASKMQEEPA